MKCLKPAAPQKEVGGFNYFSWLVGSFRGGARSPGSGEAGKGSTLPGSLRLWSPHTCPLPLGSRGVISNCLLCSGWRPSCGLQPGFSFLESLDSAEPVVGLSGMQLSLQPPTTQTKHINSVKWKIQRNSTSKTSVILTWKSKIETWTDDLKEIFDFREESLTLLIKAAQPRDSGLYLLEVTDDSGKVKHHRFRVSVFGESLGLLGLPL